MSYPNPKEAPNAFLDHLKSLNLDSAVVAFLHDQTWPSQQPNGRLDEIKAHEWCDRMDSLLVCFFFHLHPLDANYFQGKLNRAIPSYPDHKDICVMLGRLCTDTIVDIEAQVAKQREADEAEAKRLADEAKKLADEKKAKEAARLATEQKIKEMQEELAKMSSAEDQPGMGGGDDEEDNDEDEEDEVMDSGSAGEEEQVRQNFVVFHTHFNYKLSQESPKKKPKRQQEDSRKKLVQVVHTTVSTPSK